MILDLLRLAKKELENIEVAVENASILIRHVLCDRRLDAKHRNALNEALKELEKVNGE